MTKKQKKVEETISDGASMEDILSSIRQAMSDGVERETHDDTTDTRPEESDVLELHQPVQEPAKNTAYTMQESPPPPHPRPQVHSQPRPQNAGSLLSAEAENLTRKAFHTLDEEIQRTQHLEVEQAYAALERMLRPILKQWCDKHLPHIVTHSVEKEIKSLVKGLTQKNT